jgi:hypothetical protein
MKASILTCSLLISFISFSQTPFSYRRKLQAVEKEEWRSITLPSNIFNKINKDYSDLRIYQLKKNDTLEIPYLIRVKNDEIKESTIELPVLNKSKKDGKLFLTFQLKRNEGVNYLDLNFEERNFDGYVKLEGSQDQVEWFEIVNNQRILSIQNEMVDFMTTTLNFPLTNYKFLRASIKANKPLTFLSSSFKAQEIKAGTFNEIPVAVKMTQDKKAKQSVGDLRLNEFTLISKIKIDVNQSGDYYRAFALETLRDSSKAPNQNWIYYYEPVVSGYLTSIRPNEFTFSEVATSKLKLTIFNADNAPLTIEKVSASGPTVELISKLKPGENFLFYGNGSISSPSYDIVHFENQIPETMNSIAVEQEEKLSKEKEKVSALLENQWWLWGAMVVVIGLLGFATVRMMSKKE